MIRGDGMTWAAPVTVESAVELLCRETGIAVLAGGTDLVPRLKHGLVQPRHLLSLGRIEALHQIGPEKEAFRIGAAVTLADLAVHPAVLETFPALARAASRAASPQIRSIGTVGGNVLQEKRCFYYNQSRDWRRDFAPCLKLGGSVCHQAPSGKACRALYYSDLATVLVAFEAEAEIADGSGRRRMALADLLRRRNGAEGGDRSLLTGIVLPPPSPGTRGIFLRWGVRQAIDFPVASAALRVSPGGPGSGTAVVRLVAGSVASEPLRLEKTEGLLAGFLQGAGGSLESLKGEALAELRSRAGLIRETVVSIKLKRSFFGIVAQVLEEFFQGDRQAAVVHKE
jgi:4-hydroxybenzoyl-CoA reductase subunit beta